MKKIIPVILAFVIVFCSSIVPVYAMPERIDYSDSGDSSGIMTLAVYDFVFPTWDEYTTMCSKRPSSYTGTSGTVYDLDMYVIWGSSDTQDENTGNAAYMLHAFSSDYTSAVSYRLGTLYSSIYHYAKADNSYRYTYTWDSKTQEWIYTKYSTSYFNVPENRLIGTNTTLYGFDTSSTPDLSTVMFEAGRSPLYQEALDTDESLGYPGYEEEEDSGSSDDGWLATIVEWFSSLKDSIDGLVDNFSIEFKSLIATIDEKFDGFIFSLEENFDQFLVDMAKKWLEFAGKVDDLKETIVTFFENLWDGFKETMEFLFIPEEDAIVEVKQGFEDTVPFVFTVKGFFEDFFSMLSVTTVSADDAPTIEINLSNSEGKYNYGSTAFAIDFGWYLRYKPYVDNLLSFILWFGYMWLLFKRAPDIIQGTGLVSEANTYYSGGTRRATIRQEKRNAAVRANKQRSKGGGS